MSLVDEVVHVQVLASRTERCHTVAVVEANMGVADRLSDELLASNCRNQEQDWRVPNELLASSSGSSATGIEQSCHAS